MSDGTDRPKSEHAQDAALAHAGEPQRSSEAREARADEQAPSREELDAREERVTRPRKPMGPTNEVEQTLPEEP
ncbi:MAG: hypothetical protein H0W01_02020 [Pseudonocardiales bacterium]|nr:hypothetical protein [Pseudonocardiales bacterium]